MCFLGIALNQATAQQMEIAPSPFRYDDHIEVVNGTIAPSDYAKLVIIPFTESSYIYVGADLRERFEGNNVAQLGLRRLNSDTYRLHRLLIHADFELATGVRVFTQLGTHSETGRRPMPIGTDVDHFDLHQGFLDLSHNIYGGQATLRIGRAEMSYDEGALIGLRDGPNVRQVWDGFRLTHHTGKTQWDLFAVHPVQVKSGVFDDRATPGQRLDGIHLTTTDVGSSLLAVDAFYYHNENSQVTLYTASGKETTETIGARLRRSSRTAEFSAGAIGQRGTMAGNRVSAFSAHIDAGIDLATEKEPHLQIRADVMSGGRPKGGTVRTFNALYPNVAYSTEATIEAPANLIETGLVGRLKPQTDLTLQYIIEGLWRYSTKDAFYTAPLFPLIRPDSRGDRFSGVEQQLSISWRLNRYIALNTALVHFRTGAFIQRAGGRNENFCMASLAFRL